MNLLCVKLYTYFFFHDRQRKTNFVKRNLFWKLIKKRLRSNWKLCLLLHQQGLCLPLWRRIRQGWTRWLYIQIMAISQCGNIFLNQPEIRPMIMSSGLLLRSCLCYCPLDGFTFIILTTLLKYWHVMLKYCWQHCSTQR